MLASQPRSAVFTSSQWLVFGNVSATAQTVQFAIDLIAALAVPQLLVTLAPTSKQASLTPRELFPC